MKKVVGFAIAAMMATAAMAALPSGYTELEYIQGTGDAGAYICASDIYINPQTDISASTMPQPGSSTPTAAAAPSSRVVRAPRAAWTST